MPSSSSLTSYFIRRFGNALILDTETWEFIHTEVSHLAFRRDCNRRANRENRLTEMTSLRNSVRMGQDQQVDDPVIKRGMRQFQLPMKKPGAGGGAIHVEDMLEVFKGQTTGAPDLRSCIVTSTQLEGLDEADILAMRVYEVLRVDHGEEATLYVASPNYKRSRTCKTDRKVYPRYDNADVSWEGEARSPAKICFFFGSDKEMPLHEEEGEEGENGEHMYALVQAMRLKNTESSMLVQFDRYQLLSHSNPGSYHVVNVRSIGARAQLIPDFDAPKLNPDSDAPQHQYFWWDNTLPELLRGDLDPVPGGVWAERMRVREGGGARPAGARARARWGGAGAGAGSSKERGSGKNNKQKKGKKGAGAGSSKEGSGEKRPSSSKSKVAAGGDPGRGRPHRAAPAGGGASASSSGGRKRTASDSAVQGTSKNRKKR